MKKIFLLSAVCAMLVLLLSSCAVLNAIGISDYVFEEDGDEYVFAGVGESKETEITVPDSFKGKPVTSIGNRAFLYNALAGMLAGDEAVEITSITLPETITKIGKEAFANNEKLASVNIPDSVTEIGEGAFFGCSSITSITIPEGVTEIADYTFGDCSSLKSITIPASVTKIGAAAFAGCSSLETITLPDGVTEISASCFEDCMSLKNFTISENIVSIGERAFKRCTSLGAMTIPATVTTLGDNVFEYVGQSVEISVCYDEAAPEGWSEKWYYDMNGGKAINTSEVFYNNVVVPNIAKAEELQEKIDSCDARYKELNNLIGQANEASKPYQASGNSTMVKYYRDLINGYKDQQRSVLNQKEEYKEQLEALQTTSQING